MAAFLRIRPRGQTLMVVGCKTKKQIIIKSGRTKKVDK